MSDWRDTTIGDVITLQRGVDITRAEQRDGLVPVVSSGGVSSYHDTAHADGPGVVMGRKGSLGKVFYFDGPYWPHDTTLWVRDFKGNDPRFVYYFLQRLDTTFLDVGSANPTLNRNHVHPLPARWPSVRIQQGIAEVLGALDDKIEANAKLTATAESLMATRYESAITHDATQPRLEAIAQFHNRRRVPLSAQARAARVGTIPYYGATGIFGYVDEAIFNEHIVLVGEDGSVVQPSGKPVVQYVWGPAWVNNHAHVLTGVGLSTETLRLAIQRSNVTPIVTGAVQPKISMGNLKALILDVPGPQELATLEPFVSSLSAVVRARTEESRHLATIRDALLPQLMSGKITVKDAEPVVEQAV